ncbi:hypothetical protein [Alkalibacillus aidingensis]|uniref:hypothetical protein n=1 Tax=Alkalibacillus aidingensis TaxID=2747607 RepID=UPI0016612915|nr:hypothetical protein [Alkalibacillus aidingensis]
MLVRILLFLLFTLLLVACGDEYNNRVDQADLPEPDREIIEGLTTEYLAEEVASSSFDHKVFCTDHSYGVFEDDEDLYHYVWSVCGEYNQDLEHLSGASLPVAIIFNRVDQDYRIVDHRIPRDGSYNQDDIKEIFPKEVAEQFRPDVERMTEELERQVEAYFESDKEEKS